MKYTQDIRQALADANLIKHADQIRAMTECEYTQWRSAVARVEAETIKHCERERDAWKDASDDLVSLTLKPPRLST